MAKGRLSFGPLTTQLESHGSKIEIQVCPDLELLDLIRPKYLIKEIVWDVIGAQDMKFICILIFLKYLKFHESALQCITSFSLISTIKRLPRLPPLNYKDIK